MGCKETVCFTIEHDPQDRRMCGKDCVFYWVSGSGLGATCSLFTGNYRALALIAGKSMRSFACLSAVMPGEESQP